MKYLIAVVVFALSHTGWAQAQLDDHSSKIKGSCLSVNGIEFNINGKDPSMYFGVFAEGKFKNEVDNIKLKVYGQYDRIHVKMDLASYSFDVPSLKEGTVIKFSFKTPKSLSGHFEEFSCQIQILENPFKIDFK